MPTSFRAMIRCRWRHNQLMARAVWSGTISFGLVSVPVRLYPATRRKDVRFHEIDRSSGQRIRHQKVIEVPPPPPSLPEHLKRSLGTKAPLAWADGPGGREAFQPTTRSDSFASTPRPVAAGDVVKGFEVARDRYVTVDREELEELPPNEPGRSTSSSSSTRPRS